MKKISIIGMGYVGLPLAVAFQKHFNVTGFDLKQSRINELNKGLDTNNQITKKKLYNCLNLSFTSNTKDLNNSDLFIVTVPTPIYKNKEPDLRHLTDACKLIGKKIKKNNIIIFESTVFPGCTENICGSIIEKISKKKINSDFFLAYSPERINVGDKKNTLEKITKIIGASNKKTLIKVSKLYSKIIKAGVYKCESIAVAEAAKVIENAQRDINIAFINEIGKIFKKMDVNLNSVLAAASTKWNFLNFKPGLVGGHCIGVDPYYLTYIAKKIKISPKVIDAGRDTNDLMFKVLADDFLKKISLNHKGKVKILVLGLTFKENTNDLRNSKVFDLCAYLNSKGHKIYTYDPLIDLKINNKNFKFSNKLNFRQKFSGVFLAVPHKLIMTKLHEINKNLKYKSVIYDLKSALPKKIKFKNKSQIFCF
jgi:UDP-N-acetyl-D-glucosamine/UDP-N-acetyl-D-galactosamine dehydrogenase